MLPVRPLLAAFCCLLLAFSSATGQGTLSDYERAENLSRRSRDKVFKVRIAPHWSEDGNSFWYRNDLAGGKREYIYVDSLQGIRRPAFDHARLAEALARELKNDVEPDRLPIDWLQFDEDGNTFLIRVGEQGWRCHLDTYELSEESAPAGPSLADLAPDDGPRASVRNGPETSLTFTNETDEEVELFWLDAEGQRRSYGKLAAGARREQHTYAGHVWLAITSKGKPLAVFEAEEIPGIARITGSRDPVSPETPRRGRRRRSGHSPDGEWHAVIADRNVVVTHREAEESIPLTTDGSAEDGYDGRIYWSPDSKKVVVMRTLAGEEHKVYLVESAPDDQLQPKLHELDYLKPGDRIPIQKPHLFDVESRREIPIDDAFFPNPWSIRHIHWAPDSSRFLFVYNERGHQVLRVIAVDASTGQANVIVDEHSSTFVDYNAKFFLELLDATGELIWMSERDGWNHLYLYDAHTGAVKNQITKGDWLVRSVERVDAKQRQIWFFAGGIRPEEDPYYLHYCRINFDGTGLTVLTEGNGTHSIQHSPNGRFLVDTWSRVDLPPQHELRRAEDGALVCSLESADWSQLLATGWQTPQRYSAKGRDGQTDIYGVIYHPTNFDPNQTYPVIEYIYAGPQGAFVPKEFRSYHAQQALAELEFIVVQIDGMGTNFRSKAFHDVCWKNLGDAGFADRILWIKAAAETRPYMDLSRVGIYGNSAGGQSALRALLAHGDFYRAAVSSCGCHDNRMDKIWWNELLMGWPVGPHYEEQSNVTNAHKLRGDLLLIVGELDRNVDPASTMQVVHALIEADKDFELLVIPGGGHGMGGEYGTRRMYDFFVRHLLNIEPPHWNSRQQTPGKAAS